MNLTELNNDSGAADMPDTAPRVPQRPPVTGPGCLTPAERQMIGDAISGHRTLAANAELVGERRPDDMLYLLTEGWACRYMATSDGQRHMPALCVPGDICNLDMLIFPRPDYTVRMLTPASVALLPRERLLALTDAHPAIGRLLLKLAAVETATLSRSVLALGRMSARRRLAHLLCELAARLDAGIGTGASYELPLTQEQLAEALGLTSVHVNRTIQGLRAEGLVVTRGRTLAIPDMAALAAAAEFDPGYLRRAA